MQLHCKIDPPSRLSSAYIAAGREGAPNCEGDQSRQRHYG